MATPPVHDLRVILSEQRIRTAVDELGERIAQDYPADRPLVVIGVMKGALVFVADLIRRLPMPVELELVRARSYAGVVRGDCVEVLTDLSAMKLTGRHLLLVDTVLDSGQTLRALHATIAPLGPASLKTCVLLRKTCADAAGVLPEYIGCDVDDVFLVGYGLDHGNGRRHLPHIAELPPSAATV
jgi:hypoxanthine phosphoribosyltransferase